MTRHFWPWLAALALAGAPLVALSGWWFWVAFAVLVIVGLMMAIVIADKSAEE